MTTTNWTIGKAKPAEVEAVEDAFNAAARFASRDLAVLEDGDEADRLLLVLRALYEKYGVPENDRIAGVS